MRVEWRLEMCLYVWDFPIVFLSFSMKRRVMANLLSRDPEREICGADLN